ncbi:pLS20_p028 family conjugation system transmembrane protein [Lactobacillus sp. AN1001]
MSDIYDWLVNAIGSLGSTGKTTDFTSDFTSFSDLMQTMQKSGFNGNITDPTETKAALWFYNHWGNYLQAQPGVLSFLWTVLGWGVIALYSITAALEHVFNNLFKLFGLFDYLNDPNTLIGKFYQGFQILGIAIFAFLVIFQIMISIFGKPFKYKDAILHLLIVTFAVAVLPTTIVKVSSVLYTDITNKQNGIENITGKKDKKDNAKDTLAIQPVKYNTTDVMELIKGDFNTKRFPLDNYGNLKGNGAHNSITDDHNKINSGNFITHINFGATLGATDTETLENLEKKDNMKGIKGLFLHYPSDTGVAIKAVNEHRLISGANLAEKVYSRYKVNFLAIYAQYVVLIILLSLMSVKLVTSIFELLLTGLVAPIQGYSSVTSHSKFKELLLTISGTIAGIYFEVVIMRIVLEIMRDFPTIAMTVYDTNGNVVGKSATFFSGLGPCQPPQSKDWGL